MVLALWDHTPMVSRCQLTNLHTLFPFDPKIDYINNMNNVTLQLSQDQHELLTDLFSTIADLDLQETSEHCDQFDKLWDAVLDAKEVA